MTTAYDVIVRDPQKRARMIAALLQGEAATPANSVKIGDQIYGGDVALIVLSLRSLVIAADARLAELEAAPRRDA